MHKIAVAIFLSMFALASFGQFCRAEEAGDAKAQDVRKMLELSGAGKMGEQVMAQLTKAFRQQLPQVPAEFWDEMAKEIKGDEMIEKVVPIYAKHFTHDEIKQLIEFYQSPLGKRLVAEQPGIATESMQIGQVWGQQIAAKVLQKLRDKGFIPKG